MWRSHKVPALLFPQRKYSDPLSRVNSARSHSLQLQSANLVFFSDSWPKDSALGLAARSCRIITTDVKQSLGGLAIALTCSKTQNAEVPLRISCSPTSRKSKQKFSFSHIQRPLGPSQEIQTFLERQQFIASSNLRALRRAKRGGARRGGGGGCSRLCDNSFFCFVQYFPLVFLGRERGGRGGMSGPKLGSPVNHPPPPKKKKKNACEGGPRYTCSSQCAPRGSQAAG